MPESRADAFSRFFRAEHVAVVAFCFRRVNDSELAWDLAAEAFGIAWNRWDEPRRSDRAWVFGVARNLIGNEYRRRTIRQPVAGEDADALGVEDTRFSEVEVRHALGALTPEHQEVLRLTYWDGLSAAEISEVLGVTTVAVWRRLTRARREFANHWGGSESLETQGSRTRS